MTADEIKKVLGLKPHPREGGWYVRTYQSREMLDAAAFQEGRYSATRHTGTAIYYLLERDAFSEMHRLASDELFHFYTGDSVEMLQLPEGDPGRVIRLGLRLSEGERPQVVVPRGVWQGLRLASGGKWALLGCTVSPGFDFDDYESGNREDLTRKWPQHHALIQALTRS
jgi:predicted cupin superfamily sugar epimerase